jgi:hypothetical protein
MLEMILEALRETGKTSLHTIESLLPRVIAMLTIFAVGWIVSVALAFLTRRALRWLRFNRLAERTGAAEVLKKTELPPADALAGSAVFWIALFGFILSGIDALGLKALEGLLTDFFQFIPRLLVAAAVLVTGFIAANFVWRAALVAAVNANLPSARLVSGAVRVLILVMTVAMALDQLAVARAVVLTTFAIAFGAVMLAIAIALGIGGGPIARRILEQHFPERAAAPPDATTHL